MRALVFLVVAGCTPYSIVPMAVHPTATSHERSVGVAVGGSYATQGDGSQITIPRGEGWIRSPVDPGQLGVHVAPDLLSVGYRYDVGSSTTIAIEPNVGVGYSKYDNGQGGMAAQKGETLTLALGAMASIIVPMGSGFVYAVPKLGFADLFDRENDNSTKMYLLGGSVGVSFSGGMSVELGVHRVDDMEEQMTDTPAAWFIMPTFGMRR